jgi:starch synthase
MKIVHVSSEILPWSKAGGLGDVSGALPPALAARGHRVVTVAPRYAHHEGVVDTGWRGGAWLYGQHHEIRWFHQRKDGVDHLFVDHPSFHRAGIYGDASGGYGDNLFRFALLSRVALQAPLLPLDGGPLGDDVVFHVNDWHAALVPVMLDAVWRPAGHYLRAPTVLALHNVAHQGGHDPAHFEALDLSARWRASLVHPSGVLSPMWSGIVLADQLVTVSPTYAREITQHLGHGLEAFLRGRGDDLHGIVNGVGPEWDPATDPRLPATYTAEDLTGKHTCKAELQRRFGLPVRPDVPVVGFVGRLVHQKGIDLIGEVLPWLVRNDVQVVLLGSGQSGWESWMMDAPARYPEHVGSFVGYDEDRAHLITAGSDMFLMPSRFEPCGLNQLYSLRYGTVPVVHATGGLVDTVEPVDVGKDTGTGYRFWPHTTMAFRDALSAGITLYREHPEAWARLRARGMSQQWDWDVAAQAYERVYERATARRHAIAGPIQ